MPGHEALLSCLGLWARTCGRFAENIRGRRRRLSAARGYHISHADSQREKAYHSINAETQWVRMSVIASDFERLKCAERGRASSKDSEKDVDKLAPGKYRSQNAEEVNYVA